MVSAAAGRGAGSQRRLSLPRPLLPLLLLSPARSPCRGRRRSCPPPDKNGRGREGRRARGFREAGRWCVDEKKKGRKIDTKRGTVRIFQRRDRKKLKSWPIRGTKGVVPGVLKTHKPCVCLVCRHHTRDPLLTWRHNLLVLVRRARSKWSLHARFLSHLHFSSDLAADSNQRQEEEHLPRLVHHSKAPLRAHVAVSSQTENKQTEGPTGSAPCLLVYDKKRTSSRPPMPGNPKGEKSATPTDSAYCLVVYNTKQYT